MNRYVLPNCPQCTEQLHEDSFNGMAYCTGWRAGCPREGIYLTQEQVRMIANEQDTP